MLGLRKTTPTISLHPTMARMVRTKLSARQTSSLPAFACGLPRAGLNSDHRSAVFRPDAGTAWASCGDLLKFTDAGAELLRVTSAAKCTDQAGHIHLVIDPHPPAG